MLAGQKRNPRATQIPILKLHQKENQIEKEPSLQAPNFPALNDLGSNIQVPADLSFPSAYPTLSYGEGSQEPPPLILSRHSLPPLLEQFPLGEPEQGPHSGRFLEHFPASETASLSPGTG